VIGERPAGTGTGPVIESARRRIAAQATGNPYLDQLESRPMPRERLRRLAGELYPLVLNNRRSFALLAARFPDGPTGDLYLAMADGEGQALRLLLDFADALGLGEDQLRAYEPTAAAQAYPAYLAQCAVYGTRSDILLALLVNAGESGATSARVADALQNRHGFDDRAVGHFRFYADTPQSLLDTATTALAAGLADGDDPVRAVRTARLVHAYESMFWSALSEL
jgi:TENA/THI-4/PQQC family protein